MIPAPRLYVRRSAALCLHDGCGVRWIATAVLFLACAASSGQAPAAQSSSLADCSTSELPSFEIASVRRVPVNRQGYTEIGAPNTDRFTARNISLRILIAIAYGLNSNRVTSKLDWVDSTLYDVTAKAEGEMPLDDAHLRPLLQQLLKRRFHIGCHRETRDVPGYALLPAKGGPKLEPGVSEGKAMPFIVRGGIRGAGISMATFAGMLESPAGRPVIDRTGLTGFFDIKLSYALEDATDTTLPSFFTALQEQLGLKLESQKVPVAVLVIDRADQNPEEN